MTFSEAMAHMPAWVRLWVLWLTVAMVAAPLLLAIRRDTRREAAVIAVTTGLVFVSMQALFAAVGFVRLLGLAHLVIWGPLAIWLIRRLRHRSHPPGPRAVLAVFLVTICVSLAFDAVDLLRWLAGERAPMASG